MPIYEYECSACEHTFEIWCEAGKNGSKKCPVCKKKATKVFHAPSLIFKGSGWHVNDYGAKKPEAPAQAAKEKAEASKTENKTKAAEAGAKKS